MKNVFRKMNELNEIFTIIVEIFLKCCSMVGINMILIIIISMCKCPVIASM